MSNSCFLCWEGNVNVLMAWRRWYTATHNPPRHVQSQHHFLHQIHCLRHEKGRSAVCVYRPRHLREPSECQYIASLRGSPQFSLFLLFKPAWMLSLYEQWLCYAWVLADKHFHMLKSLNSANMCRNRLVSATYLESPIAAAYTREQS